jgi:hypothetical protein
MSWENHKSRLPKLETPLSKIVAGTAAILVFVGGIALLGVFGTGGQGSLHTHPDLEPTPTTNLAGEVIDPNAPTTGEAPTDAQLDEEAFRNDYTDEPMPIEVYEERNPPEASGLPQPLFELVKQESEELVRADVTLQGRENYRDYFGEFTPPTALASPFEVTYSAASRVSNHPDIARGVVFWTGDIYGGYTMSQVRQSVYFRINGDGTLTPIKPADLPRDISGSDLLINRITIPE